MLAVNGTMFLAAGGQIFAGGAVIAAACADPTPAEPLACGVAIPAGTVAIGSGTGLLGFGVWYFKNQTLPAVKNWGCN